MSHTPTTEAGRTDRVLVSRRSRVVRIATGVAAAFGLSATGVVLGSLIARAADVIEVPDLLFRPVWAFVTAAFIVFAGMSVQEMAGEQARIAVAIATVVFFGAVSEIMRSIESLGVDAVESVVIGTAAVAFGGLLLAGVALERRRNGSDANGTHPHTAGSAAAGRVTSSNTSPS